MSETAGPTAFEQVTRERVDTVAKEVSQVQGTLLNIWKSIGVIRDELSNRLPPWVTWVISTQAAMIAGMFIWILDHVGK